MRLVYEGTRCMRGYDDGLVENSPRLLLHKSIVPCDEHHYPDGVACMGFNFKFPYTIYTTSRLELDTIRYPMVLYDYRGVCIHNSTHVLSKKTGYSALGQTEPCVRH